jgi:hypothetical protein
MAQYVSVMNQRPLLRVLSQPKPRYIIPKRAQARAAADTRKNDGAAILVVAFVFWLTYLLMRQFGG